MLTTLHNTTSVTMTSTISAVAVTIFSVPYSNNNNIIMQLRSNQFFFQKVSVLASLLMSQVNYDKFMF